MTQARKLRPWSHLLPTDCMRDVCFFLEPEDWCQLRLVCRGARDDSEWTASIVLEWLLRRRSDLKLDAMGSLSDAITSNPLRLVYELTRERLFLVGGGSVDSGMNSYRLLEEMVPMSSGCVKWEQRREMPRHRGTFKMEATAWRGKLVLVSGDGAGMAGTLAAYCPLTDQWTSSLPSLPSPLIFVASAAGNDLQGDSAAGLYVSGGINKVTSRGSKAVYRLGKDCDICFATDQSSSPASALPSSAEWNRLSDMPSARFGHSSAVYDGKLWVVGGQESLPAPLDNTEVNNCNGEGSFTTAYLDLATLQWHAGPVMTRRRMWARLVTVNKQLLVVGGDVECAGNAKGVPTIERLQRGAKESSWEWGAIQPFPLQRRLFASTSMARLPLSPIGGSGGIVVFGGCDQRYESIANWDAWSAREERWQEQEGEIVAEAEAEAETETETETEAELGTKGIPENNSCFSLGPLRHNFLGGAAVTVSQTPRSWGW